MAIHGKEELTKNEGGSNINVETENAENVIEHTHQENDGAVKEPYPGADEVQDLAATALTYYKIITMDLINGNKKDVSLMVAKLHSNPELKEACSDWFIDGSGWMGSDIASYPELAEDLKQKVIDGFIINMDNNHRETFKILAKSHQKLTAMEGATPIEKARESYRATVESAKETITHTTDAAKEKINENSEIIQTVGLGILGVVAVGIAGYGVYKVWDHFSDDGDVELVTGDLNSFYTGGEFDQTY